METACLDVGIRLLARAGAGSGQRIFRGGRVCDYLGAQDAHRSTARRGQPHGAPGAARARQSRPASSPRRSSASRWPASAWAGLASRRWRRCSSRCSVALPAGLSATTSHTIAVRDRIFDHHRAPHRARRARAENRRAAISGNDVAHRRQAHRAVSQDLQPVHPRAQRHGLGGRAGCSA